MKSTIQNRKSGNASFDLLGKSYKLSKQNKKYTGMSPGS